MRTRKARKLKLRPATLGERVNPQFDDDMFRTITVWKANKTGGADVVATLELPPWLSKMIHERCAAHRQAGANKLRAQFVDLMRFR